MELTQESTMPFGKFKGRKMKDVPAWFLLNLYKKQIRYRSYGRMKDVMIYITDHKDELEKEHRTWDTT
jgi:uncharacterized protein (DUF3820 family)